MPLHPAAAPGRGLTGMALKRLALVTMLLDHIGAVILESPVTWAAVAGEEMDAFFNSPGLALLRQVDIPLRLAGRVAFPIFCFLLVEGFLHTRSVRGYALRLGAFALLSELPFNLALGDGWRDPGYQNVFFTLLLGLLAMAALRRFGDRGLAGYLLALCCVLLAELLSADYGAFGVVLILVFYLFRNRKGARTLAACLTLWWGASIFWLEVTAPLALVPIWQYNGERGRGGPRYLFYLFYPAHLLALWGLRVMLFGG